MDEDYNEDHNNMRGSGGLHGVFETKFVNRFDGWSISFQTVHDETEERRVIDLRLILDQRDTLFLAFS